MWKIPSDFGIPVNIGTWLYGAGDPDRWRGVSFLSSASEVRPKIKLLAALSHFASAVRFRQRPVSTVQMGSSGRKGRPY